MASGSPRKASLRRAILRSGLLLPLLARPARAEPEQLRLALLRFGTTAWEAETIRREGLDRAAGIELVIREVASGEAAKVALQAGAVDLIVTDWIWVARQRAAGAALTCLPYSRAVGALMTPPDSSLRDLPDLRGKRLGIAGGPLDKSWLLLRALARAEHGLMLDRAAEAVFAAPPLLEEELARGRLDAVLTYWQSAARLEIRGCRAALTVQEVVRRLGVGEDAPLLCFAFREDVARSRRAAIAGFAAASRDAKRLLATSDAAWEALGPRLGTTDPALRAALRAGYVAGIPGRFGAAERDAAARLHAILADLGGETLVGRATGPLDQGTFWPIGPS
jgi:NitT/TauT family transport system substrate-binding protein